jgi:hypothetical protein
MLSESEPAFRILSGMYPHLPVIVIILEQCRELGDDVPPSGISIFGAGEAENKFEYAIAGVDAGIVRYEGFNDSELAFLTWRRSVGMCLRFYINVHFVQRG